MTRNRIDRKIFEKIKSHPNVDMVEQSIKNAITQIRKKNGITINAAAQIFAESRGFSVFRYLDDEDIESLKNSKDKNIQTKTRIKSVTKIVNLRISNIDENLLPPILARNSIKMAEKVYPLIYVLENSLRHLILSKMNAKYGSTWWDSNVPSKIRATVEQRKTLEGKNRWHSIRGAHEIFYTDFGDLVSIIDTNWDIFKDLFPSQKWIESKLDEIELSRNIIAHNNLLPDREIKRIKLYFGDFKRQLNK